MLSMLFCFPVIDKDIILHLQDIRQIQTGLCSRTICSFLELTQTVTDLNSVSLRLTRAGVN